ncbi:hypothetical protein OPQ81_011416 [Rhizoctonia solani]|nr:hypothetical protein OPQ81_011416 [Rhizoctonia solani]
MCKLYTASLLSTLNARSNIKDSSATEAYGDTIMVWRRGSLSNHQSNVPQLATSRRSEGFKPNISVEGPEPAVHIVTTTSSHQDSSYEMRDRKRPSAGDLEAYMDPSTFSHATVKLSQVTSSAVISDEASVHSKTSNYGK